MYIANIVYSLTIYIQKQVTFKNSKLNQMNFAVTLSCGICSHFQCDQILENSSKSHMKYNAFLYVFNDISIDVYVFLEISSGISVHTVL